jgi:hypothetical protein
VTTFLSDSGHPDDLTIFGSKTNKKIFNKLQKNLVPFFQKNRHNVIIISMLRLNSVINTTNLLFPYNLQKFNVGLFKTPLFLSRFCALALH